MKILKILGIIILVIAVLFAGLIIFSPSSAHFEREITIKAPAKTVFAEVSNMRTFNTWSPWFKMDPEAEYLWEGPSSGIGAKQIWYSENEYVGNGYMMVSETRPYEFVGMEMAFDNNGNRDFSDEGEEKPLATFVLSEQGEETKVTWTFDISGVSGTEKLMNLALPMFLGPAYEEGLSDLKTRIENRPILNVEISQIETKAMPYLGIKATSSSDPEQIGMVMGEAYGKVIEYMNVKGIEMAGAPIAIVLSYEETGTSMICGLPTSEFAEVEDDEIMSAMTYEGLALKTVHKGDYALMESTYNDVVAYASYNNFEDNGSPWEVYITDPMNEPDTAQWITEIYYPVK